MHPPVSPPVTVDQGNDAIRAPFASVWLRPSGKTSEALGGLQAVFAAPGLSIPTKFADQWHSLQGERDPELLAQGLLAIGRELKFANAEPAALAIFQHLNQNAGNPVTQAEARREAEAILGQGSSGARLEYLTARFGRDATDYKTIAPMILGTAAAGIFKAAALSQLAVTPAAWWSRGKMALALANGFAFAGEVGVFAASARGLSALSGSPVREKFSDDVGSAAISIGALKLSGALGNYLSGKVGFGGAPRLILQQGTTFLGMRGAHFLEEKLKLRESSAGATGTTDTLASMLSMGVGAHLGNGLLGKDFAGLQAELEARVRNQGAPSSVRPWVPERIPALAGAPAQASSPARIDLPLVMMSLGSSSAGGAQPPAALPGSPPRQNTLHDLEAVSSQPVIKLKRRIEIDTDTLEQIEAFPGKMAKAAEGESNPVFFGLNHLKWWLGLIRRDFAELGADALFQSGKILFGRWPKAEAKQKSIEASLKKIVRGARIETSYLSPSAETFWRPFWEFVIGKEDASGMGRLFGEQEKRVLATVLQDMHPTHPEIVANWLQELAEFDVDASLDVQEMMEGDALSTKYPAHQIAQSITLTKAGMAAELGQLYQVSLASSDLDTALGRLLALRIKLASHDVRPASSKIPMEQSRLALAKQFSPYLSPYESETIDFSKSLPQELMRLIYIGYAFRCIGNESRGAQLIAAARSVLQNHGIPVTDRDQWLAFLTTVEEMRFGLGGMQESFIPALQRYVDQDRISDALNFAQRLPTDLQRQLGIVAIAHAAGGRLPKSALTPERWFEIRQTAVEAAVHRGTLSNGLKLQGSNESVEAILEWAHLGYALKSLGHVELAESYFKESELAGDAPRLVGNHQIDTYGAAPARAVAMQLGQLEKQGGDPKLLYAVDYWMRLGQVEIAWQVLRPAKDSDPYAHSLALAHFAKHFAASRPFTSVPRLPESILQNKTAILSDLGTFFQPDNLNRGLRPNVARLGNEVLFKEIAKIFYDRLTVRNANAAVAAPPIPNNLGSPREDQMARAMLDGSWSPAITDNPNYGVALKKLLGEHPILFPWLRTLPSKECTEVAAFLAKTLSEGHFLGIPDVALTKQLLGMQDGQSYDTTTISEVLPPQRAELADMPPGSIKLLIDQGMLIGRLNAGADPFIAVDDGTVSRAHATLLITRKKGKWRIDATDVGSTNGSFVHNPVTGIPTRVDIGTELPFHHSLATGAAMIHNLANPDADENAKFFLEKIPTQGGNIIFHLRNSEARPTQNSHQSLPLKKDHFKNLPRRAQESIPSQYRSLIPNPKGIVLFERFKNMLQEASYLVTSPDRIAIRFFGPPGTAKTTIPELIAGQMGTPLLRVPFSKRTDPSDLAGMWTIEEINGEMVPVFKEGAPTIAMEYGFHLVFDEPDLARAGVLAYANNISAPGKIAWVRKQDGGLHTIAVHPDFRVWVTENGVDEVGREEHGKDFLRRFVPYYVAPWSEPELATVLAERYENFEGKPRWNRLASQIMAHFHRTIEQLAQGMTDPHTGAVLPPLGSGIGQKFELTPRTVLRLARRLVASGPLTNQTLSRAIRAEYILPLADQVDRELVWNQANAIWRSVGFDLGPDQIPAPSLQDLSNQYFGGKKIVTPGFVWTSQAIRLADEILWNKSLGIDVMLLGDAGQGKTELPPRIAELLGQKFYQKTISSETDEEDLVGGFGRVGGKIQFIPDIVYKGTEEGAITQLDEWFLGDGPKMESTTNPLMDDARALIIKNPYRVIPRHPDSFFIFSSNAPWGGYADRHEHSGASMSRVAVINLSGEFEMSSKDRLEILLALQGDGEP